VQPLLALFFEVVMVPIIGEIAKGLISPISDILKEVVTDKDERNRLAHDIAMTTATHAHEQTLAQIEVNNTQAKHSSLFVSGARPAVMWICALSLFYSGFVYKVADIWVEMPPPDNELLIYILGGLLGLSGMRSFEKSRGVARDSMRD
jgi:hypothetical protein